MGLANGCKWNADTCASAAREGKLEVLKWARENGCEWDESTCYSAVLGEQLEVLKWARENGCDWDVERCLIAASRSTDKGATKQWIIAHS